MVKALPILTPITNGTHKNGTFGWQASLKYFDKLQNIFD